MPNISDSKILILTTDGFEESELFEPLEGLRAKGATVEVATPYGGPAKGWKDGEWGRTAVADLSMSDVKVDDYIALVLPGGQMNPDILRANDTAVELVRSFAKHNKIVAAICHAPWLLIEAGIVKDREMTAYPSIRTDLRNAGANVVDQEIAISNGIITSRDPGDLPAFIDKIIEEVEEGEHPRKVA